MNKLVALGIFAVALFAASCAADSLTTGIFDYLFVFCAVVLLVSIPGAWYWVKPRPKRAK